jgi:cytochrome c biogenesis protein
MSATRSNAGNAGEGETPPGASAIDAVYRFLSSVRFAIFVLSCIAVSCIIGTLIPQQAPVQEYLSRYSPSTYAILRFLGLTEVFHSPWFLFLAGLFVVNLFFCSLARLGRFLRGQREHRLPTEKALEAMPHFRLKGKGIEEARALFRGYRQAGNDERGMVLHKGSISRSGVYVIHGSIIIILIGSLLGLMFGYRGTVTLAKGETKDAIMKQGTSGSPMALGFSLRLTDFQLSFYPNGEPKDYVSSIEIVDKGEVVRKADVRVNHPLGYGGVSIYQATYGSDPAFLFDIGGEKVRLLQGSAYRKGDLTIMAVRFERSIHNFGPGVLIAYLEGNETKTSWFVKDVPRLREKDLMGVPVRLDGIESEYYTGLEVSHDPGVGVVWTGFAMILFGLYINFFMYERRIYLLTTPGGVLVAGSAPRNREAFREEFEKRREKAHGTEQ